MSVNVRERNGTSSYPTFESVFVLGIDSEQGRMRGQRFSRIVVVEVVVGISLTGREGRREVAGVEARERIRKRHVRVELA